MEDEDNEQEEQEEEQDEINCNICQYDCEARDIAISFEEKESENQIDICKDCLRQILKQAKVTPETKIVEKIVEKPVEKIIYRTIDKNGNEVGGTNKTKFD
jgi:hypothetical protein